MTLVSCFRFSNGYPYLVGDALTSREIESFSLDLPSYEDLHFESTIEGVPVPVGLCQKVALLSNHLAIGWSGGRLHSATLIREISDEFGSDEVDGNDVVKFITGKEKEYNKANLVGICKQHDVHYVFYFNGARKFSHPQLEDFYAIGSGSSLFAKNARENLLPEEGDSNTNVLAIAGMFGGSWALNWSIKALS